MDPPKKPVHNLSLTGPKRGKPEDRFKELFWGRCHLRVISRGLRMRAAIATSDKRKGDPEAAFSIRVCRWDSLLAEQSLDGIGGILANIATCA